MNIFKLAPLDIILRQYYDYTYWKILSSKTIVSWPDHVFGRTDNQDIKTVKLLRNDNNFGDHRAIGVELKINEEEAIKFVRNYKKIKLDWNNGAKTKLYTQCVNTNLIKNKDLILKLSQANNKEEAVRLLNSVYSLTVHLLITAGKKNPRTRV